METDTSRFLYEKDGNLILVEPMKSRTSGEICRAYNELMQKLQDLVVKVTKHILHNEASKELLMTIF